MRECACVCVRVWERGKDLPERRWWWTLQGKGRRCDLLLNNLDFFPQQEILAVIEKGERQTDSRPVSRPAVYIPEQANTLHSDRHLKNVFKGFFWNRALIISQQILDNKTHYLMNILKRKIIAISFFLFVPKVPRAKKINTDSKTTRPQEKHRFTWWGL